MRATDRPAERFDLHVHSSASDGSVAPAALLREAARCGVAGLALTDHDTIAGLEEAIDESRSHGIHLLPGVEISVVEAGGDRQMHVLGLGIDLRSPSIGPRLERMREERRERALRMLDRLRSLGVRLPDDFVEEAARRGSVGRPHLADALVRFGFCRTLQEAFDRFIGRGGPAYVGRRGMSAAEAIGAIHAAGGIAVLAHPPLSYGIDRPGGLEAFIDPVVRAGLDGLEVEHPGHSGGQRRTLARIARARGLLQTGGSDFHGATRPGIDLGRGRGNVSVSGDVFRSVLERVRDRNLGADPIR